MDLMGVHQVQCLCVAAEGRQKRKFCNAGIAKQGHMGVKRSIGETDAVAPEVLDQHLLDCLNVGIVFHSQPKDASSSLVKVSEMRKLQANRVAGKPIQYLFEKRQQERILLAQKTQCKVQIGPGGSSTLVKQHFDAVLDGTNCVQRLLIKGKRIEDSHGSSIGFRDWENHTIVLQEEIEQNANCTHWSWKRSVWLGYAR